MASDYSIYHNLIIKSSAEEVFDAVSNPEKLINWWPDRCTGIPEEGQEYNFFFSEAYNWFGQVIKCVPGEAFHIKMTRSDADWDPTSFGFDLTEKNGVCQVNFWHINWPECNEHFKVSSYCWAILLKGLKDFIEKGTIIPFIERE